MSFSRVKVAGWAFGEILTSSQMNTLDVDHANAIDGLNGGSNTLVAPLSIGGNTVTIDTLATVTFSTTGNATIGNAAGDVLLVNATTSFQADMQAAQDLQVLGNAEIQTDLEVQQDALVGGNLQVTQNAVVTDNLTVNGRIIGNTRETAIDLPNLDTSVDVTLYRNIRSSTTVTTTRVVTLTGSVGDGDWFIYHNRSGSAQTLAGLVTSSPPNGYGAKYVRVSGSWILMSEWTKT